MLYRILKLKKPFKFRCVIKLKKTLISNNKLQYRRFKLYANSSSVLEPIKNKTVVTHVQVENMQLKY